MPLMTPSAKSGAKVRRLSQLTKPRFALLQRLFFEGLEWALFSEGCFSQDCLSFAERFIMDLTAILKFNQLFQKILFY